jgi:MFS family permease
MRIILPARALSTAVSAMTTVALLLHLHDSGAGGLAIAALMACTAVPTICVIGFAGRVADGRDSRTVLGVTALIQAVCCLALVGSQALGAVYPLMIVMQTAGAFAAPTWAALVPRASGEALIGKAVAWQQGLNSVAAPTGMALGGFLVGLGDIGWVFVIDAATFAALLIAGLVLHTRRNAPGERERTAGDTDAPAASPWNAGLAVVRADVVVWPLFVALMPMVLLVEGINPAEIFLARDELGASPWQYGLTDVFAGVGAVFGSYLAARRLGDRFWTRGTLAGFAIACAAILTNGFVQQFWVYVCVLVVLATGSGLGNACLGAVVMTRTADADRGKVQATLNAVAKVFSLAALAIGGGAVGIVGPRPVFVAGGIGGLAVLAIAAVAIRGSGSTPRRDRHDLLADAHRPAVDGAAVTTSSGMTVRAQRQDC